MFIVKKKETFTAIQYDHANNSVPDGATEEYDEFNERWVATLPNLDQVFDGDFVFAPGSVEQTVYDKNSFNQLFEVVIPGQE